MQRTTLALRLPAWKHRSRNRILTDPYEPGSTYKGILAAAY